MKIMLILTYNYLHRYGELESQALIAEMAVWTTGTENS